MATKFKFGQNQKVTKEEFREITYVAPHLTGEDASARAGEIKTFLFKARKGDLEKTKKSSKYLAMDEAYKQALIKYRKARKKSDRMKKEVSEAFEAELTAFAQQCWEGGNNPEWVIAHYESGSRLIKIVALCAPRDNFLGIRSIGYPEEYVFSPDNLEKILKRNDSPWGLENDQYYFEVSTSKMPIEKLHEELQEVCKQAYYISEIRILLKQFPDFNQVFEPGIEIHITGCEYTSHGDIDVYAISLPSNRWAIHYSAYCSDDCQPDHVDREVLSQGSITLEELLLEGIVEKYAKYGISCEFVDSKVSPQPFSFEELKFLKEKKLNITS